MGCKGCKGWPRLAGGAGVGRGRQGSVGVSRDWGQQGLAVRRGEG